MTFQEYINLIFQAMQPEFTVFGVTLNLWSFFVWSIALSVVAIIINQIMRW